MDEQNQQEYEAVKQAVLDYAEGVYEVDPTRIELSVHPNLSKGGFFKQDGEAIYSHTSMTYEQMKDLARTYNEDGKMPKDAPIRGGHFRHDRPDSNGKAYGMVGHRLHASCEVRWEMEDCERVVADTSAKG